MSRDPQTGVDEEKENITIEELANLLIDSMCTGCVTWHADGGVRGDCPVHGNPMHKSWAVDAVMKKLGRKV